MAVPKQKKGRGATHTRRSANSKLSTPGRAVCPSCGAVKLPHHVCPSCGFYKDREIIITE
jgi:large subunit ribosomal protein L32